MCLVRRRWLIYIVSSTISVLYYCTVCCIVLISVSLHAHNRIIMNYCTQLMAQDGPRGPENDPKTDGLLFDHCHCVYSAINVTQVFTNQNRRTTRSIRFSSVTRHVGISLDYYVDCGVPYTRTDGKHVFLIQF